MNPIFIVEKYEAQEESNLVTYSNGQVAELGFTADRWAPEPRS